MVKRLVSSDEWYPVFTLEDDEPTPRDEGWAEFTDTEIEWIEKVQSDFGQIQLLLAQRLSRN